MITIRDWTVHHAMYQGECVRCGYREEWREWPLGAIDRTVLATARETCTTVTGG